MPGVRLSIMVGTNTFITVQKIKTMNKIKITCKCGEEIEVNPASLMAKARHQKNKPTSEQMKAIRKKRTSYPKLKV